MSIRSMSAITSEDISTDILESPIYQRHQQYLDEYYTWLLSSRAGGLLTAQSVFLNSATRTLYRLSRECENTTYELDQQGPRMSQTQQDVYDLTQWCRLQANDIDARRDATFIEFSTLNNYPLSRIQQAWDLATLSAEEITRQITKEGWGNAVERRWRAELDWRFGRTRNRPTWVLMMPRERVVVDEIVNTLVESTAAVASSSRQGMVGARHQGEMPDRTRKGSTT
jgi:DNA-binding PucR family transcriptional regulator